MKRIIKFFSIFIVVFIVACTSKSYYLKPEIQGYLYDLKTQQPIANQEGYISFYLGFKDKNRVRTDERGHFKVPADEYSYYFFKPNIKEIARPGTHIYINFAGYMSQKFDYLGIYQKTHPDSDYKKLESVDVGIIYLEDKIQD